MPDLRFDALTDRHVLIAPARAARPGGRIEGVLPAGTDPCPFCPGNEDATPPELARRPAAPADWRARAFRNLHPLVVPDGTDAAGDHEILVVHRDHHRHLAELDGDAAEFLALAEDRLAAHADLASSILFVNHGTAAGATLPHPHAQLVSTAFVPPRLQVEQDACSGPAGCTVCCEAAEHDHAEFAVASDDTVVAWCPPASVFPYEVRIAPRRHTAAWSAITRDLVAWLPRAVRALEAAAGGAVAYNLVWHGGLVGVHAHVHLWAATSLWAGFEHGTDVPVVSVDPADSAARMRAAWGV